MSGVHRYVKCPECHGVGAVSIRPKSEWTNDIAANFKVCSACHGLGRVRAEDKPPAEKAESAGGS